VAGSKWIVASEQMSTLMSAVLGVSQEEQKTDDASVSTLCGMTMFF
jgi:hypothetical protein